MKTAAPLLAAILLFTGCQTRTTRVDIDNPGPEVTQSLAFNDFAAAQADMIDTLLRSGRFKKPDGSIHIMAIGEITLTGLDRQSVDPDLLTAKISEALTDSGQVYTTSAIAGTPGKTETLIDGTRTLRHDNEFNPATTPQKGQLLAPDLALSGSITARNIRRDNRGHQLEYTFQLRITDPRTGLQWWQRQTQVIKRTDSRTLND